MSVYYKLDLTHPDVLTFRQQMMDFFGVTNPDNILSVNVNDAGTFAWVKLATEINIINGSIVDTAFEPHLHASKVIPDVRAPLWEVSDASGN